MKKSWLMAGVLVGCGMGASIGACGSSTTPGGTGANTGSTTTHSSTGTNTQASSGSPASGNSTSGNSTSGGLGGATNSSTSGSATGGQATTSTSSGTGGSTCEAPSTLHPPEVVDAGFPDFYCPFSGVDGGKAAFCPGGGTMECCETAADAGVPASCMALGSTSCPSGSTIWGCDDPSECTSGNICCGTPYSGKTVSIKETAGCTDHYASEMGGTSCMAAAACTQGGGVIMCTSAAECSAGQTCVPFRKAGNQVGACQ